jgi:hypothetical protein
MIAILVVVLSMGVLVALSSFWAIVYLEHVTYLDWEEETREIREANTAIRGRNPNTVETRVE